METLIERKCKVCGREVINTSKVERETCSKECFLAYRNMRIKDSYSKKLSRFVCKVCGKVFYKSKSSNSICNETCYGNFYYKRSGSPKIDDERAQRQVEIARITTIRNELRKHLEVICDTDQGNYGDVL